MDDLKGNESCEDKRGHHYEDDGKVKILHAKTSPVLPVNDEHHASGGVWSSTTLTFADVGRFSGS
jgi:hypothetical protein